jgi:hypothetical protein
MLLKHRGTEVTEGIRESIEWIVAIDDSIDAIDEFDIVKINGQADAKS